MKILILDDTPERHDVFKKELINHDVTHCFTASSAYWFLDNFKYDVAFLDHDLGNDLDGTGMIVVKHIIEVCSPHDMKCVVHSWNTSAATRMTETLIASNFYTLKVAFGANICSYLSILDKND